LSLCSTPPFGIESNKAVAFNPETARSKKLGVLTYADERLTQGNRVSIQGRVEPEHRRETAKVNLGTSLIAEKA
jgi:hypothetical protein